MNLKYIQLLMGGKNDKTWQTALHAFTEWNPKQRVLVWLLNYRCWFYACIKYAFVLDCYFLSKGWPWKEWPVDKCPKRGSHGQFSSNSHVRLCNPMDCGVPDFPVYHQPLEIAQTLVHQVSDVMQPSQPMSSPSLPAFNLSQHQGLFQWVSSSHQVAKVLKLQSQHQSFQWMFRTDFL